MKLLSPLHQLFIRCRHPVFRLLLRFRYPVSMPEDVAADLGLSLSNFLTFKEFVNQLTNPHLKPAKLTRFMPREQAEKTFQTAIRKEKFQHNSLFSYYFNEGWMEFVLQFDEQARLRRLYIQHRELKKRVEISIS
jgi:hypothetical protein